MQLRLFVAPLLPFLQRVEMSGVSLAHFLFRCSFKSFFLAASSTLPWSKISWLVSYLPCLFPLTTSPKGKSM